MNKKKGPTGRGVAVTDNSAAIQLSIRYANLPAETQVVLSNYISRKTAGYPHNSDPETGHRNDSGKVSVKEYYPHGKQDPRRLVSRSFNSQPKVWYYSSKHTASTYTYHRITDLPQNPTTPLPGPLPVPGPPPITTIHLPAATPPPLGEPLPTRIGPSAWDD